MKKGLIGAGVILTVVLWVALLSYTGCDASGTPIVNITMCESFGGYCADVSTVCADGTFYWEGPGCPGGKCCLPSGSCANIGGLCISSTEECPEGMRANGPMDCAGGRSSLCCLPVE